MCWNETLTIESEEQDTQLIVSWNSGKLFLSLLKPPRLIKAPFPEKQGGIPANRVTTSEKSECMLRKGKEWRQHKIRFSPQMKQTVSSLISEHNWSPKRLSSRYWFEGKPMIRKKTIHSLLHRDKRQDGTLYLPCCHTLKYRKHKLA